MSTFALPRQSLPLHRRKPLSQQIEIGITTVLVVIGMMLSLLALSYLFYANAHATQDYHLKVLQEKRANLVTENEVLDMRIAASESLETLSTNEKIKHMAPAEDPLYMSGVTLTAKKE